MMNYEDYVQASGDLSPSYGNFPVFMNSSICFRSKPDVAPVEYSYVYCAWDPRPLIMTSWVQTPYGYHHWDL